MHADLAIEGTACFEKCGKLKAEPKTYWKSGDEKDLTEYYFDMETTGIDYDKDEIITIQWQRLGFAGEPIGELNILKSWDSSEKEILENFIPKLTGYCWDFVFIGKNLLFDSNMLNQRMKHHNLGEFNLRNFDERVTLDIGHVLVLINNGFKGYDKLIPKTNPLENKEIPRLFRERKFPEIIQYIKDEANDFIKAFQTLKREMPSLVKHL